MNINSLSITTPEIKSSPVEIDKKIEIEKEAPPKPYEVSKFEEKETQAEKLTKLKSLLAEHNINLEFSRDEATNELVIKLIDDKTGESIRQFPSEVSLKLAATYAKIQGQILDQTA